MAAGTTVEAIDEKELRTLDEMPAIVIEPIDDELTRFFMKVKIGGRYKVLFSWRGELRTWAQVTPALRVVKDVFGTRARVSILLRPVIKFDVPAT